MVDARAEVRGAGSEVGVVEVVGLDARLQEGAHQVGEGVDVVVDAGEQDGLAQQRYAGVNKARAGGAGGRRQFARMVAVHGDVNGLGCAAECLHVFVGDAHPDRRQACGCASE